MIKYISLFSGIGAPEKALEKLNIPYELLGFSEIDKFAIKSYCKVHNVDESLNLGDITKIDINTLPTDIDLITHGSPCQSFSVAGKGHGGDEGSGTRSSLMWNTVAICKHCKPKYVIWENVKNVLSKRHRHNFDKYLDEMGKIGYDNYYEVLNAKHFNIPQNRERIFVISIRKDLNQDFKFPVGQDCEIRLKDILEEVVDKKYYVDDEKCKRLFENIKGKYDITKAVVGTCHKRNDLSFATRDRVYNIECVAPTICATDYKDSKKILCIGNVNPSQKGINGNVYDDEGLSPTITTNKGEGLKILESSNDLKFVGGTGSQTGLHPIDDAKRIGGLFDGESKHQAGSVWDVNGLSPTLDTMQGGYRQPCIIADKDVENTGKSLDGINRESHTVSKVLSEGFKIRKLTPKECWRLMGFEDEDFNKAAEINSNTQLYKQAGNSIVVNVLVEIFKQLFN